MRVVLDKSRRPAPRVGGSVLHVPTEGVRQARRISLVQQHRGPRPTVKRLMTAGRRVLPDRHSDSTSRHAAARLHPEEGEGGYGLA
jgi:hypothetical protein